MFARVVTCMLLVLGGFRGAHGASERLLLSQLVSSPSAAELVAIHNPNAFAVDLGDYYLSDTNAYYAVTTGDSVVDASDFVARFPAGATIAAGATRYVSINGAANYEAVYLVQPDFELVATDAAVADMRAAYTGSISATAGLTNAGEPVMLFYWDGASDLVVDVDYVYYGTTQGASPAVNKTGIMVGQSTYLADTADATGLHAPISATTPNFSCRRDFAETGQVASGGNGVGGTDQTSEPNATTWEVCPFGIVPDRIFVDAFGA